MSEFEYSAELKVSGDPRYLRPVRVFIRELAISMGFSDKRVSDIELAVDEVFSNAVEHGSACPSSQIIVNCVFSDDSIKITVSDTGFNSHSNAKLLKAWSHALNKISDPGTERGHGLLLANNLADEMKIESNSMGGVDVHLVIYKEEQHITEK
ncbi:hypothetical protein GF312_20580 [Candidatus Poribacteria bacterium]|nr:hypothetical protein [Candidatus Poribacteria bacterium]